MPLNDAQEKALDNRITPYFERIVNTLKDRPDQLIAALQVIFDNEPVTHSQRWQLEGLGVWKDVEFFHHIFSHPAPQNCEEGKSLYQPATYAYYKGSDGVIRTEEKGLLSLTELNDPTNPGQKVTKAEVLDFIKCTAAIYKTEHYVTPYELWNDEHLNALDEKSLSYCLSRRENIEALSDYTGVKDIWFHLRYHSHGMIMLLEAWQDGRLKPLLEAGNPQVFKHLLALATSRAPAFDTIMTLPETIHGLISDQRPYDKLLDPMITRPEGANLLLNVCYQHKTLKALMQNVSLKRYEMLLEISEKNPGILTDIISHLDAIQRLNQAEQMVFGDIIEFYHGKASRVKQWYELEEHKSDEIDTIYGNVPSVIKLLLHVPFKDLIKRHDMTQLVAHADEACLFLAKVPFKDFVENGGIKLAMNVAYFKQQGIPEEALVHLINQGDKVSRLLLNVSGIVSSLVGREIDRFYTLIDCASKNEQLFHALCANEQSVAGLVTKRGVALEDLVTLGSHSRDALTEVCERYKTLQTLKKHGATAPLGEKDQQGIGKSLWQLTKKLLRETSPEWIKAQAEHDKAPTEEEKQAKLQAKEEGARWEKRLKEAKEIKSEPLFGGVGIDFRFSKDGRVKVTSILRGLPTEGTLGRRSNDIYGVNPNSNGSGSHSLYPSPEMRDQVMAMFYQAKRSLPGTPDSNIQASAVRSALYHFAKEISAIKTVLAKHEGTAPDQLQHAGLEAIEKQLQDLRKVKDAEAFQNARKVVKETLKTFKEKEGITQKVQIEMQQRDAAFVSGFVK